MTLDELEPDHAGSPTSDYCERMALFGLDRHDEGAPQLPPDPDAVGAAMADLFDALVSPLQDTFLQRDLPDLLWTQVNLFQRQVEALDRKLDANEAAQKTSRRDQDGSEVRSLELERLLASGRDLLDRRDALEDIRDRATALYRSTPDASGVLAPGRSPTVGRSPRR